ncbi:tRNA pseudouridine(38-40) synthase TruA [Aquimarina addita]|uniref:tRNA pseudouridine synthase A n=1 Tax=Aquimarina addita TaxID=870485 RepID=A0ABP7XEQ1_9FLAO
MRYFLELSYNGASYHGWQRQPNAVSVQEVLENALSLLLRTDINTIGAGRTDAGVHARQIMVHFDFSSFLDTDQFIYKMNAFLPVDIAVQNVRLVKETAHARFDALSRSYQYLISCHKDPFSINSAYHVKKELDIDLMNEAAKLLLNYSNFKCFSKSKTNVKTYNCTITNAVWEQTGELLVFNISANRFLRNMVRAIVGTLIEIGTHKLNMDDLVRIVKSEDRSEAGYSVPAHGLYLTKVDYPKTIYLNV